MMAWIVSQWLSVFKVLVFFGLQARDPFTGLVLIVKVPPTNILLDAREICIVINNSRMAL
jgi:hypothetical protein